MNTKNSQKRPSISFWLLERTGGIFLSIAVFLAGLIAFPIGLISFFVIKINTEFSQAQSESVAIAGAIAIFFGLILLVIVMRFFTPNLRERLSRWAQDKPLPSGKEEQDAQQEITSIFWSYAIAMSISFGIMSLLLNLYQYFYGNGRATYEQITYTLLGSAVFIGLTILTASPMLEKMLRPVHTILLSGVVDGKLSGVRTSGFQAKFQGITFGIIVVSILLIAPLGYHETTVALGKNIDGNRQLLQDLFIEYTVFSAGILLVGLFLSYLLSQQIFKPLHDLVDTFDQVEKGNLKQRASITTADEIGELSTSFNRMVIQLDNFQQGLEKRIANRTEQLRASNEVGKIASTILDPDVLVAQTVNLIANTFSYYFVAIFLISDDRWAELKDATGTAGEVLKENRHRVLISDNNLVGAAIVKKEAQIALDVGVDAKVFYNPLLPYTRSELTLPLVVGDRVIGALDVHSQREADFTPDDISTLQGMTNQVAIAIENARLFKEMDETLEELRQANRQYVVTSWSQKLRGEKLEFEAKSFAPTEGSNAQDVEIGLNLRDQNIGYIRLQTENEWNQEDQSWVESLATQVAISLENARLIEESQESALRERLSASIVQKIWASNSIDNILQTAVRELGRALEASEATIELKIDDN
jgi:GAF domain-containing protein/HAMP domain-containing protein